MSANNPISNIKEQDLRVTIKNLIANGKTKEEIYLQLLNSGLKLNIIDKAYKNSLKANRYENLQNKLISIFGIVGAVFIGAGIFLLISSNWQALSKTFKVIILTSLLILTYYLAWFFEKRTQYKKLADSLILLANIVYGANIFLLGQTFNINTNWIDGLNLWFLGIFAAAVITNKTILLKLNTVVAAITSTVFGANAVTFFFEPNFLTIDNNTLYLTTLSFALLIFTVFYLNKTTDDNSKINNIFVKPINILACNLYLSYLLINLFLLYDLHISKTTLLLVFVIYSFFFTHLTKSRLNQVFAIILSFFWLSLIFSNEQTLNNTTATIRYYQTNDILIYFSGILLGLVFWQLGLLLKKSDRLRLFYLIFSNLIIFTLLFKLSSLDTIFRIQMFLREKSIFMHLANIRTTLIVLFVLPLILSLYLTFKNRINVFNFIITLVLLLIIALIFLSPETTVVVRKTYIDRSLTTAGLMLYLVLNIYFFAHNILLLILGYIYKNNLLINLAVILLFLALFIKYFTLFESLISRGLFTIITGFVLILLAFIMQKIRVKLIKQVETNQNV